MTDKLVEVKLNKHAGRDKYSGLCGFYIKAGETKMCPMDVYKDGEAKGTLVLVDEIEKPIMQKEPEPEVDLEAEVKDVTDALLDGDLVKAGEETKDLISKVGKFGKKKSKK